MKIRLDGQKVLSLMAKNLMSQSDLAKKCNMCHHTICYAIGGKSVTIKTLGKIAKALEVDPSEIAVMEE